MTAAFASSQMFVAGSNTGYTRLLQAEQKPLPYACLVSGCTGLNIQGGLRYAELRQKAERFNQCFYRCFYSSTLPPDVIEAVAANLAILKFPRSFV